MARFAVFERIKLHQIFKAASILLSRLTQAFASFSFKSLARFLLILSFVGRSDVTKGTFLVPHFCVPIDYKRTNFFTRYEQNVHSGVKEEHFVPSSYL